MEKDSIATCNEWRRYIGPKMLAKSSKTAALEVHLTSSVNSTVFLGLSVVIATCNEWRVSSEKAETAKNDFWHLEIFLVGCKLATVNEWRA